MFLRMVTHAIRGGESEAMAETYGRTVIAALRTVPGCSFASLLQNTADPQECVSLTLWKSPADSVRYEESGRYTELVDALRPYFIESTEWKLELSADLSLEYTPIPIEPTVERFAESLAGSERIVRMKAAPFAVHVLTFPVTEEKEGAFTSLFAAEVQPNYRSHKGFIDLIMVRHRREYHIISFWDERVDLMAPDGPDSLMTLMRTVERMMPSFVRWQVSHPSALHLSASSEGVGAKTYRCLTASWF